MLPTERRTRLLELGAELREIEAKAGLTEAMRSAQEHCVAFDANSYWRRIKRDAYFSVQDSDLRNALINKCAQCDLEVGLLHEEELIQLRQVLEMTTAGAERLPWVSAAAVAVLVVAVGAGIAGVPGAIGGAVAGIFLGQGVIQGGKVRRLRAIKIAQANLDEEAKMQASTAKSNAPTFTSTEIESGHPDEVTNSA